MDYLKVPFREKDRAKSLGASWDREASSWYVPAGVDLAPFSRWLPVNAATALAPTSANSSVITAPTPSTDLEVPKGIPLSRLLAGVAAAVAAAYREGVWVRAEGLRVDARNQNVYLELTERTTDGDVIGTGRGFIASLAPALQTASFPNSRVPRAPLSPQASKSYPRSHIAEREARILEANKQLPAPEDFQLVLVIAPQEAAGLGDFRADANILHRHGVCAFVYAHARFQGDGSAADILAAASEGLETGCSTLTSISVWTEYAGQLHAPETPQRRPRVVKLRRCHLSQGTAASAR